MYVGWSGLIQEEALIWLLSIYFGIMTGMVIVLFLAIQRIVETESLMRSLVGELLSAKGIENANSYLPSGGTLTSID